MRPVLAGMMVCLLGATALGAAVERSSDAVTVRLAGEVTLTFALEGEYLLGLARATVDGVELTSPDTCLRPYLAREFGEDRVAWPLMRLKAAKAEGDGATLEVELLATGDEAAYRALFVWEGDPEAALSPEHITPELATLKKQAGVAAATIEQALSADEIYAKAAAEVARAQAALDAATTVPEKAAAGKELRRASSRAAKRARAIRPGLLESDAALRAAQKRIAAFEAALEARALEVGRIQRDFYRLGHTRLPAEVARREFLAAQVRALGAKAKAAGTLRWVVAPATENVAGWPWVGWTQHYEFDLAEGRRVNGLRQLGTWELGGRVDGLTLVNLRYRGLGHIEQRLTAGPDGGVRGAFSTTETLPGAAGEPYAISPKVPRAREKELSDRGYALRHRAGAWIAQMARGAGHGFVDFQYRPAVCFASSFARQGNLRALTECFPGDPVVSQTEVEFFPLSDRGATTPQTFLVLATPGGATVDACRTRWQEMDQAVRDRLAAELDMVAFEALPGVGILSDAGWAGYYRGLAEGGLDAWADSGVRLIAYHNPGWINGRYPGPDGSPATGGGVCNIYDWWPTKDVEGPWRAFQAACARRKVAFYPWLGQTIWRDAPFVERLGLDREHWSLNTPDDAHGPGYGPMNMKGNIRDAAFREAFVGRLAEVRRRFGYQGFWADSFQNLFMSQLAWSDGSGTSLQRRWWEEIAAWSRRGVGWMGESHAVPGLSCSIEVAGWEGAAPFFQHVWKWLRGNEQQRFTGEALDALTFRIMARKGWLAPDHSYKTRADFATPSFKRLAHEFLAARPAMRRGYELGEARGTLWLPFTGDAEGVWFPFVAGDVPEGVTATSILDAKAAPVAKVEAERTYRVRAGDLRAAFGVAPPPLPDPRLGRTYEEPTYTWLVGEEGAK